MIEPQSFLSTTRVAEAAVTHLQVGPRTQAWWICLVIGAPLVIAYELMPEGFPRDMVYASSGVLAIAGVLVGVRLHRPVRRRAWFALAGSQAAWVLGDVVGAVRDEWVPVAAFPTAADIFYLAGYPLLALSLFLLTLGRRPRRDVEGVLDAVTVAAGLYLLCWVLLVRPTLAEAQESMLAAVVGAAYPLLDLGIITMLAALVISPGTHTGCLRLLSMAIALVIVADTSATALGLLSWDSTDRIDFVWMVSYLLVGTAALHPSIVRLSAPAVSGPPTLSGRRQIAASLAVLVAPGTLAVEHALGTHLDIWAVVISSTVMFSLVVARMNLVIRQIVAANHHRDEAQRELAFEASHDALTGLSNRAQSLSLINASLSRAQRSGAMIALLFIDLDGFKYVNDTYGHRAGDEVLGAVARRFQEVVRAGDLVGRLGGDEFVVLLEPVVDEPAAVMVGQRLVDSAAEEIVLSTGPRVRVGASVGVAISQDGHNTAEKLLVEADLAAYRAIDAGKGRTEVFGTALRRELQSRAELEAGLREALDKEQLLLRYRPIVDLVTRLPVAYEAVAHWNRPGVGQVPVPQLRVAAEASDLIVDLDAWAMSHAATQVAAWQSRGHDDLQVSVRVSNRHTGQARLLTDVRRAVAEGGLQPQQLIVQISDLQRADDVTSLDNLAQLQSEGFGVSLDDFGIGNSPVRRLQHLPVEVVKVDESLLLAEQTGPGSLLALIVRGAQNFGLRVVMKGVRDERQVATLQSIGCTLAQGPLFGDLIDANQVSQQERTSTAH